ncbi:FimV/HubP family polar landmark protein [Shewanella sp. TC10]|uniref:FimV/HubP family polar landmark protein n=1 Tax=Shewanella sp. TC10 TaxID=1419739 RepID=UPI00129E68C9|nr:FimV/HubP family polar landmark protein [Shewanella sp. TC10]
MIFRTSYFVGIMACAMAVVSASHFIEPAHAETLRITGPNGEVSSAATRQYGPTTSADTFWSIAQKVRPNQDISVYQVMAALFDANPHAFSSDNYNSLERGMTLLIPSADVMVQISRSEAKTRAENNDKRLPNANKPSATNISATNISATSPAIPSANNQPSAQKPLQIVADPKQPTAEELAKQAAEQSKPQIDELTVKLEEAQSKALSLTDELARSEDMLMVKDADNAALKAKIQELTLQLSAMQEDFQLLTEKYQGLETAHQQLVEQNNQPEVVEEPTDFWRSISDNMLVLAVVAALPLIIIFLLIFWLMRRKSKAAEASEAETAEEIAQPLTQPEAEVDDVENLAIHLDEDEAASENIDDLMELETAATEELSLDDSSDADMYITEDADSAEEAEGTSLDDLWAEAMEEQEEDLQPLEADEDDLDSLLEGLDTPIESDNSEAAEEVTSNDSVADEDDLDNLLAGFDESESSADTAESESDPQDDIDNLLAGFDEPEPSADTAESESDPQDDIDNLLAGFDEPESSADAAESEPDTQEQDDIDNLLAGFDTPDNANSGPSEAEPEVKVTEPQDDIDSLLADFDLPAETSTESEVESKVESSQDQELNQELNQEPSEQTEVVAEDDLDALLASIDAPAEEEHDFTAEIAAELEDDVSLSLDETANIDELVAEVDPEKEFAPLSNEGLDVEQVLNAELEEIESELSIASDNDDIDSLISELESETTQEAEQDEFEQSSTDLDATNELSSDSDLEVGLDSTSEPSQEISDIIADIEATEPQSSPENDIVEEAEAEAELDKAEPDFDELLADLDVNNQQETAIDSSDVQEEIEANDNSTELKFAPGDESALNIQDDLPASTDTNEDPLVAELLAAEHEDELSQQSHNEQDSDIDELDALLADFDVDKIADEEVPLFSNDDASSEQETVSEQEISSVQETASEQESISEQDFDAMLSELSVTDNEPELSTAENELNVEEQPDTDLVAKESGFFDDLKSKKSGSQSLDWEADLFQQASNHPASEQVEELDTDDDSYQLVDDNLTVDEALAALDAQEAKGADKSDVQPSAELTPELAPEQTQNLSPEKTLSSEPSDDMLNTFEQENGFIDIDKLLNDADEDVEISDQYKDVDVDMGEVNSLIGNAEMIDVDDEENSVNAKLDLARAYIEIEDEDAAKAILKEVQIDGNERQQTEAGKLLKDMS